MVAKGNIRDISGGRGFTLNSGRELKEDTTEKAPRVMRAVFLMENDGTQLWLASAEKGMYWKNILDNSRQESGEQS